jgi:aquaporin Z
MKKLIIEFVGTLILVFSVGNAVASGSPLAPLAIGAALMIAIYAGGHITGGHYNPAVSIAVWRRGKMEMMEMFGYWGAQISGGVVAALLVKYINGDALATIAAGGAGTASAGAIFVAEMLWTFVLAWVVLNVATAKKNDGNSFYGLAIGFTVASGAVSLGGISGGVFNPAVYVGLIVMGLKSAGGIVLFWGAQLIGGLIAAEVFKATSDD